jgi:arylsulfatase A
MLELLKLKIETKIAKKIRKNKGLYMFKIIVVPLFLFLCFGSVAAEKPNIVFFFIDDMGYGDIQPFGSKENQTPHLNAMAAEGIKFTDFYVSNTACTPSRSALLTGSYAARVGMDGKVVFPGDKRGLNPSEITIADMLKANGYTTGCFGKWHLGDAPEFLPTKQGFDEYEGIPYSNDMWPFLGKRGLPELPYVKNDKVVAHIPDGQNQALVCDAVTNAAVDFIKRNHEKPFFAYIPHSAVHHPRFALKERVEKAEGSVTRAQIEEVDASVGKVISTLKELGIEKNTLVFFTSDNGGARGTSMGPLRGAKGGPKYEGHMRVPTVAWWPGRIPAGSVTNEIGATIDILPTIAKLTGSKVPTDRVIDGKDISPLLLAEAGAKSPHEVHYYEIDGVRRGSWKLVKLKNKFELYNLSDDLGEQNDLSGTNLEKLVELKGLLEAHTKSLQSGLREAAFVNDPNPLDTTGTKTLAEYMGIKNLEVLPMNGQTIKAKKK